MFNVTFGSIKDAIKFAEQFKAMPKYHQCDDATWALVCRFERLASDHSNVVIKTIKDIYTDNNGHQIEQIVLPTLDSPVQEWIIVDTSNYGRHESLYVDTIQDGKVTKESAGQLVALLGTQNLMIQCRDAIKK